VTVLTTARPTRHKQSGIFYFRKVIPGYFQYEYRCAFGYYGKGSGPELTLGFYYDEADHKLSLLDAKEGIDLALRIRASGCHRVTKVDPTDERLRNRPFAGTRFRCTGRPIARTSRWVIWVSIARFVKADGTNSGVKRSPRDSFRAFLSCSRVSSCMALNIARRRANVLSPYFAS